MSEAVRPIHLPGSRALDSLRQRAQAGLDVWAREWVSGSAGQERLSTALQINTGLDEIHTQVSDYEELPDYEELRGETGCMWFRLNDSDRMKFARAVAGSELMLGTTCVDEWVAAVVDRARDVRNRSLCAALLGAPHAASAFIKGNALPADLFAFGSGAVHLSCDSLGLHAIADGGIWRSVPPGSHAGTERRANLTPLDQAVRGAHTRLDVILGSVEIELSKLLDMRCGDVLRLPQRLDQGIAVLCDGNPLARAALGETRGRKCVQLIARHS